MSPGDPTAGGHVTIAAMRAAHIAALMPYERDMFGPEAWSAASYRAELADTRHRTYVVAETGTGELLGWAGIRVIGAEAEILTVGVVPTARRHGTARRLLGALLDEARARAVTEVYLEVRVDNDAALALYETDGFVRLGVRRGYYDGGRVDAVTMRKTLL